METMMQRVGAAILLAEAQWNPKTAKESKETVMARAAIEAMREPTPEVMAAGVEEDFEGQEANVRDVWRAMIDAALTPSTPPPLCLGSTGPIRSLYHVLDLAAVILKRLIWAWFVLGALATARSREDNTKFRKRQVGTELGNKAMRGVVALPATQLAFELNAGTVIRP